jgi:thiol-disulfide isomerase/thioredoxin
VETVYIWLGKEPDMSGSLTRRELLVAAGAATAALAGCTGGGGTGGGNGGAGDGEPDGGVTEPGESRPTWQTTTFTDATTDETFAIEGFDSPVVLHTFATWCSTCKRQQGNIATLADRRDDIEFIDLTIDPNDNAGKVASHAESNGFGWHFGVASADLTRSLVDDFGQSVTTAPRSPVIVVCPDGAAYKVGKVVSADTIESTVDSNCG